MQIDDTTDDVARAISFLSTSGSGYTTQDVLAGIVRLEAACERLEQRGTADVAAVRLREQAKEVIRLARKRVARC